jgi:two-component system, OmpR family, KDP operon response regulator KdpE
MAMRVLIVDNDSNMRQLLRAALSLNHYRVFEASTAIEAFDAIWQHQPELVLLDVRLSDMSSIAVIRSIRQWNAIPIVALGVDQGEMTKVRVLDAGADDYVSKPFSMQELMARLRAASRHIMPHAESSVYTSGDLAVDLVRRLVMRGNEIIHLTPTEYDLLRELITHVGRMITRSQLETAVWGAPNADRARLLRVHIRNLRLKLEPDPSNPRYILTQPGVGYTLNQGS